MTADTALDLLQTAAAEIEEESEVILIVIIIFQFRLIFTILIKKVRNIKIIKFCV